MPESCDICLLGAGDIRHLLCTVAGLQSRSLSVSTPKVITIHHNDIDKAVIARDVLLLDVISQINPEDKEDMGFLWCVWYNMALSEEHYMRLKKYFEDIAAAGSSEGKMWKYGDKTTEMMVTEIIQTWMKTTWDLHKTDIYRQKELVKDGTTRQSMKILNVCLQKNLDIYIKYTEDAESYYQSGVSTPDVCKNMSRTFINPTLMRPGSEYWHVHRSMNPFMPFIPFDR